MKLRVFTLPTCRNCPAAKKVSQEVAAKYGLNYSEVDLSTPEGQLDGLMLQIMSTPSIAVGDEVIFRGRLPSREELENEVKERLRSEAAGD